MSLACPFFGALTLRLVFKQMVNLLEHFNLSLQNTEVTLAPAKFNTRVRAYRRFPRDCHQHYLLRVPRYGAVHCKGSVFPCRLLVQRPMLYPVELRARCFINLLKAKFGRGREIRTPDILLPKQARYQTALYPEITIIRAGH